MDPASLDLLRSFDLVDPDRLDALGQLAAVDRGGLDDLEAALVAAAGGLPDDTSDKGRTLGQRWSRATFSAAERSVDGQRVRQFDADEIVALARAFDLPISWFSLPPPPQAATGVPAKLRTLGDLEHWQTTLRALANHLEDLEERTRLAAHADLDRPQAP